MTYRDFTIQIELRIQATYDLLDSLLIDYSSEEYVDELVLGYYYRSTVHSPSRLYDSIEDVKKAIDELVAPAEAA